MGDHSAIEWTDATWNPLAGCTRVSAGCDNCYAATQVAGRLKNRPQYKDLAVITPSGRAAFNGVIRLLPERLEQPLNWRRPRRIFVNSMSDLFHEDVPFDYIDDVFAVMAVTPEHTYQVLTKRPDRMRDYMAVAFDSTPSVRCIQLNRAGDRIESTHSDGYPWPLPNVWLGTSCENQETADARIPVLLETPAAVWFISAEPLLGPIQLRQSWCDYLVGWRTEGEHICGGDPNACYQRCPQAVQVQTQHLSWVIVGGESGLRARRVEADWIRAIRDECVAAGVPFLFKQWGGRTAKAGGRLIDFRTWDEYPVRVTESVTPADAVTPEGV